ncbi:MAG: hypothetical protein H6828_12160 [Planctomycetes bacterium]|nr:hypothetical protein [Planctomycetota bacterium]
MRSLARPRPHLAALLVAVVLCAATTAWREQSRASERDAALTAPPEPWVHAPAPDDGEDDDARLVLDAAVLRLDRASPEEALLVGGSVELRAGEPFDLHLDFQSTVPPAGFPASFALESARTPPGFRAASSSVTVRESFPLASTLFGANVSAHLRGSWEGTTADGVALVRLDSAGFERLAAPGRTSSSTLSFFRHGLAARPGSVAVAFGADAWLLLVGVSDARGPQAPSNRIDPWRERALAALAFPPPTRDDLDAWAREHPPEDSSRGSDELLTPVDPALELAQLAVGLADAELARTAREQLDAQAALARLAAVVPWHPDAAWAARFRSKGAFETPWRLACVVAAGVVPAERAEAEPLFARPPGGTNWDDWRWILSSRLDPLRVVALDPALDVCERIVPAELERDEGNYVHAHVVGAFTQDLGESPAAREAWSTLREHWLRRGGWRARLADLGLRAPLLWIAVPWLLALALALALRPRAAQASLSPGALSLLLLPLGLGVLGQQAPALVGAVVLLGVWALRASGTAWLDRASLTLALGAAAYAAGAWAGVLPRGPALDVLAQAVVPLGLIWLGLHFAREPLRWAFDPWVALIGLEVVLLSSGADPGPVWLLRIVELPVVLWFLAASQGSPPLRPLPATA